MIHAGASLNTLGAGMATITRISAAPMPIRLAPSTITVMMIWMRIRRRCWLSVTRPSSREP
ncbi:hypothetical protein I549_5038 [Mycobacterium avium subsp. avium 2285 (R)]|nr:hypothetical protein I549_5038 [Mycobacterium avium subsp. avium 2285 (R)]